MEHCLKLFVQEAVAQESRIVIEEFPLSYNAYEEHRAIVDPSTSETDIDTVLEQDCLSPFRVRLMDATLPTDISEAWPIDAIYPPAP